MSNLEAAHQLRLQQLLESGRRTPAASPTPDTQAAAEKPPAAASKRNSKKRKGVSKFNLEAVAEANPQYLPDAMNYIVCVSSRSTDVQLENDHSLHCLCSFPSRQAAHDWIVKHRLALARHYLMDPRLSSTELEATAKVDGLEDEYYLGEHTSLEIIQVPHWKSAETAPDPSVQNLLFNDHFATNSQEEEAEAEAEGTNDGEATTADGDTDMTPAAGKKATASPGKRNAKRRKL